MEADFATIRDDLRRLRESTNTPKLFGSESHGFRPHSPLSEVAVVEFETLHQIALPPEYRGFLIHVGNGGAGPAYGLFKLGEMDDGFGHKPWIENGGFVGILAQPFPLSGPWNDLSEQPIYDESRKDNQAWEDEFYRQMDAWEERVYWNTTFVNGAVPICHLGCALRQWLVVTGPEVGNVWDDRRADLGGLRPYQQSGRERVTFLQWYRSWLDEALSQI